MSAKHEGGNAQPTIDREEHRSFNGINAKAVIPYEVPNQTSRYDYANPPVYYIGANVPGATDASATWTITKYDLTDTSDATGLIAYNTAWTDRASGTYS
jgi:hypothetical protein